MRTITEFGLDEDNLTKEEMTDLLKALKDSKSTVQEEEFLRQKVCNNLRFPFNELSIFCIMIKIYIYIFAG